MHACPSSDELQNFLDQALDADYVARILAHVEDCYLCQQSLERLTVGGSAIREGLPPAGRSTDLDATAEPAGTEIVTHDDQQSRRDRGPRRSRPRAKPMQPGPGRIE